MKKNDCIRDKDGKIIALLAGMSEKEISDFLKKYVKEGAHLSAMDK